MVLRGNSIFPVVRHSEECLAGLVEDPAAATQHEPPAQLCEVHRDVGLVSDHILGLVVCDLDRGDRGLLINE